MKFRLSRLYCRNFLVLVEGVGNVYLLYVSGSGVVGRFYWVVVVVVMCEVLTLKIWVKRFG